MQVGCGQGSTSRTNPLTANTAVPARVNGETACRKPVSIEAPPRKPDTNKGLRFNENQQISDCV